MNAESLNPENYYSQFERSGTDLDKMHDILSRMDIPVDIKHSLESVHSAAILVLGSATERNIDSIAWIDQVLRPGRGNNDGVLMIDYNNYPMQKHSKHWDWLEKLARTNEQQEYLPYPDFVFAQANMMQLPLADETIDIVVSDYTVNFLDDLNDVRRTFDEAARVLKPGGVLLLSAAGNEYVDPSIPLADITIRNPQTRYRIGGSNTSQFPMQAYRKALEDSGLVMRVASVYGTDISCAIVQKPTA